MRSRAAASARPSASGSPWRRSRRCSSPHLAERPAPRLSGGQQQRVAIARAMVGRPQVLLFDEPLSNLDARLRVEMRNELRRIQRQIGLTSIYVTHDQAEALAVSDWIMVMKDGRIVERGRPLDIYRYPRHVFTAQFLGTTNLIAGTVADVDAVTGRLARDDRARPHRRHRSRAARWPAGRQGARSASGRRICRRRRRRTPARCRSTPSTGTLTFAIFAGVAVEAELRCGEIKLQCLLEPRRRPDARTRRSRCAPRRTPAWCCRRNDAVNWSDRGDEGGAHEHRPEIQRAWQPPESIAREEIARALRRDTRQARVCRCARARTSSASMRSGSTGTWASRSTSPPTRRRSRAAPTARRSASSCCMAAPAISNRWSRWPSCLPRNSAARPWR